MYDLRLAINYKKNPRNITKMQRTKLKDSLADYGDLSGIVINVRTNEIVSGNQRSDVLKLRQKEIVWDVVYEDPTKTGTVALGKIDIDGELYAVRLVDWDQSQSDRANLLANKGGGFFDYDILINEFEEEALYDAGFTRDELSGYFPDDEEDEDLTGEGDGDYEGKTFHQIIINCKDPQQQREMEFLLVDLIEDVDPSITYELS